MMTFMRRNGKMKKPITVFAVYSHDYSGESCIEVFYDELDAYEFMIHDMETVIETLKEQGYDCDSLENDDNCEVWVGNGNNIHYEWDIYESTLR